MYGGEQAIPGQPKLPTATPAAPELLPSTPAFTRIPEKGIQAGRDVRTEMNAKVPELAERRQDLGARKRVAEMSPEEMRQTLLTSDKTGLPNRRAFDEAQTASPAPAVFMSDADGLKAFNDKFGYEAGDALLKAKAKALQDAGVDASHDKGDEFLGRGLGTQELQTKLEMAREKLRNKEITFMHKGEPVTVTGADFSYGTGEDLAAAEKGLKAHKAARKASGSAPERGKLGSMKIVKP